METRMQRGNGAAGPGVGSGEGETRASTEVTPRAHRRRFDAAYKRDILRRAEEAGAGGVGELLRKEGLYSSHLANWRREAEKGALEALGKKRGRKPVRNPLADELAKKDREIARLRKRLEQAEVVIDVQKKVAALLGTPLESPPLEGND